MLMNKILTTVFALLCFTAAAMAQNVTVTGTITDAKDGAPVIASVIEQGTTNGAMADIDGNYSISVPEGAVLEFSSIGYVTVTKTVTPGIGRIDVVMQQDMQELEEVVVTALGIKRQEKALSYNTQTVDSDELTRVKDANMINSLVGKVAGVTIQGSSSGIGGASKVVMRGTKSIEGSNNALYVIDGVPMYNSSAEQGSGRYSSRGTTEGIADLNPDDIESMTVLTGASAAALYGSSAANGAILITTKKGKEGKVEATFTTSMEFASPFIMPEFQNTYGSVAGEAVSWGAKQASTGYEPVDFFDTAATYTNSLSVSMGNDKNQTYASVAATNANGLVPNNVYDRYNLTLRNSTSAFDGRLKLDIGAQYIIQRDQNMVNQGEYMNPLVGAYLFPRGMDWNQAGYFEQWDEDRGILTSSFFPQGEYTMQNPYWVAYRNIRTNKRKRFIVSLGLSYTIKEWSPSEKLDIGMRYRVDRTDNEYQDKRFVGTVATLMDGGTRNGYFGQTTSYDMQNYLDLLVNFNKNIGRNFGIAANVGASLNHQMNDGTTNQGPLRDDGLPNVFNVQNIEQGAQKAQFYQFGWTEETQSVFGSVELNWKRMLYLTVTGRNDWASQLAGSDHKSFFYPSVGLSGVITDMLSPDTKQRIHNVLSFAKARVAFAQVASPFQRGLTMQMNTFDQNDKKWVKKGYYPLKNLQPERTNSFEVGISTKWLVDRLTFDVTYYRTNTYNQTIRAAMSASSGYNYTYVQTGNVQNEGVELAIGGTVEAGKFSWNTFFTYSYNRNEIKELVANVKNPQNPAEPLFAEDELLKDSFGNAQIILRPGGTLGDVYARTDFVRDAYGNIDISKDLQPLDEYTKLGSLLPDANMGWSNDFRIGHFGFGFTLSARLGGIVISGTQAAMDYSGVSKATEVARDKGGVMTGDGIVVPAQSYYQLQGRPQDYLAQYYTYSASNLRLREAYISYDIPRKWLGNVLDINVSIVGKNLLMLWCKAPFDPETVASTANYGQGIDYFMLPSTRSFGFNIKLRF